VFSSSQSQRTETSRALKMKTYGPPKKSAAPYSAKRCRTPQERSPQSHRRANLNTRFTHHVTKLLACLCSLNFVLVKPTARQNTPSKQLYSIPYSPTLFLYPLTSRSVQWSLTFLFSDKKSKHSSLLVLCVTPI